jgi:hypothetical protein
MPRATQLAGRADVQIRVNTIINRGKVQAGQRTMKKPKKTEKSVGVSFTRNDFRALIKRAITPPAPQPAPKSTGTSA